MANWPSDQPLLAKSNGELLIDHLNNVCAQAQELVKAYEPRWPMEDGANLERIVAYAALLHDFGKIHPDFQGALKGGEPFRNRHEVLSLAFLEWLEVPDSEIDWLTAAIATHHREWADIRDRFVDPESECSDLGRLCRGTPERNVRYLYTLIVSAGEVFAAAGWNPFEMYSVRPFQVPNYGVAIPRALDRVRSLVIRLEGSRPARPGAKTATRDWRPVLAAIHVRGWLLSADHLASFGPQHIRPSLQSLADVDALFPEFHWKPHQRAASLHAGSGMMIAPTGSGKTEGALRWAGRQAQTGVRGRVLIVLPYQASLNAMQRRLVWRLAPQIANNPSKWNEAVSLLHGRAVRHLYEEFLSRDHTPDAAAALAKRSNELARLYAAPVAAGTIFQIIQLLFATRGAERLLVAFSGARIVVDEIHAYAPDITALALAALRFLQKHLGARVLIMSATVPSHLQKILSEQLGLTPVQPEPVPQSPPRHAIRLLHEDSLGPAARDRIVSAAREGSVLVVVNQVVRAIRLWESLTEEDLPMPPRLLHSRFSAKDRAEIESGLEPQTGVVLIATQAVEVSLDLDFDVCFTELAPVESMVQRFGRCNRRGAQKDPASVFIFLEFPDGEKGAAPYGDEHLRSVESALIAFCGDGRREFGEEEMQQVLEASYTPSAQQLLAETTTRKVAQLERVLVEEWRALGAASSNSRRELEEAWESLFEGKEVLPEQFIADATHDGTWHGIARHLVPISERQFRRFSQKITWAKDLGCFTIGRPYGQAGLDLHSKDGPSSAALAAI